MQILFHANRWRDMRKLTVKDTWCQWHAMADSCEHGNEHPGCIKCSRNLVHTNESCNNVSTYGFAAEYILSATLLRHEMADNSFKRLSTEQVTFCNIRLQAPSGHVMQRSENLNNSLHFNYLENARITGISTLEIKLSLTLLFKALFAPITTY